uniref:CCHC-type domain-containing protein n=1 Tax=Globodera rostochiensis TaxID=31243 RepID=A0A914H7N7_GLORO
MWKEVTRRITQFVLVYDIDVNLHARDNIIKLQSLIHNQFMANRFNGEAIHAPWDISAGQTHPQLTKPPPRQIEPIKRAFPVIAEPRKGILKNCSLCLREGHQPFNCMVYRTTEQRITRLTEQGRCLICAREGHRRDTCSSTVLCFRCGGNHHVWICSEQNKVPIKESNSIPLGRRIPVVEGHNGERPNSRVSNPVVSPSEESITTRIVSAVSRNDTFDETASEAAAAIQTARQTMSIAGMNLREFVSADPTVLKDLPPETVLVGETQKVLGIFRQQLSECLLAISSNVNQIPAIEALPDESSSLDSICLAAERLSRKLNQAQTLLQNWTVIFKEIREEEMDLFSGFVVDNETPGEVMSEGSDVQTREAIHAPWDISAGQTHPQLTKPPPRQIEPIKRAFPVIAEPRKGILKNCSLCLREGHQPFNCMVYRTTEQRITRLTEQGRCLICAREGHRRDTCSSTVLCFRCGGNHHVWICPEQNKVPIKGSNSIPLGRRIPVVGGHNGERPNSRVSNPVVSPSEESITTRIVSAVTRNDTFDSFSEQIPEGQPQPTAYLMVKEIKIFLALGLARLLPCPGLAPLKPV